ncbi:helix-turn-helix transcriptional regulator [Phormidium sp. FACHB-592]|uniref:Helix-turn-helix domain-containing protein n=1 Tax=Stenomitos frigidus AS-A4 TaxID=2933935 RepID=A0ABV0KH60_9CYAN|nr:helix-turn-helix transcriptional regulator [Phormidium sp. FACHB-592]MBD2076269.1 helix-turn-helix transcriptional regulator [Phormidium sp. FACHB-592]
MSAAKDKISSQIGDRFRQLRIASNKTQKETAKFLGIHRTAIVKIESGDRLVAAWELSAAASLFGVEVISFYQGGMVPSVKAPKKQVFDFNQAPFTC